MAKSKEHQRIIDNLESALKRCKNKDFNVYFFVYDTKGKPSGSLGYIYRTAYELQQNGYNVTMLYQNSEKEIKEGDKFVGPGEWLEERYASLKHLNVELDNVEVTPADFIFIPEVFSDVMQQTKTLPCKRVALLENFNYIHTFMPLSATWGHLGIRDAVSTTERQAQLLDECFPNVRTRVVRPAIEDVFAPTTKQQELTVNIVSRDMADIKRVVALFYWKYPMFKWISFNELRDLPRQEFADALAKSPFTVWLDNTTNFGYSALEAMKSGSVVIGKVPEETPEWMIDETTNSFKENGIWFTNINDVHHLLAGAINAWLLDKLPEKYIENGFATAKHYSGEAFAEDVKRVYIDGYFAEREKELTIALGIAKNKDVAENTRPENNETKNETNE